MNKSQVAAILSSLDKQLNGYNELRSLLEFSLRYLEHPDVQSVTKNFALPGSALVERIHEALNHEV